MLIYLLIIIFTKLIIILYIFIIVSAKGDIISFILRILQLIMKTFKNGMRIKNKYKLGVLKLILSLLKMTINHKSVCERVESLGWEKKF